MCKMLEQKQHGQKIKVKSGEGKSSGSGDQAGDDKNS